MKKITLTLALGLLTCLGYAQEFQWVKKISGTTAAPFSVRINDLSYDTAERIIVSGAFTGTVDFDPGTAVSNETAIGTDGFAACYNGGGELLWVYTTNEAGNEEFTDGVISYGSAFGRKFTGVVLKGTNSFYLRALELSDGAVFTSSPTYSTSGTLKINDIDRASTATGRYFVTGSFTGTLTVGSNSLVSSGGTDVMVICFETGGTAANQMYNLIYANKYGGTGNDEGTQLYADTLNTRIVGFFSNTIDFNVSSPGTITRTSNGGTDCFYADLIGSNGGYPSNLAGTLSFGGTADDAATCIFLRGSQFVIGGRFRGTVNFNPNGTANNITATGGADGFVASYNGTSHFAVKRGGTLDDEVRAVTFASAGASIYYVSKLGGTTTSTIGIHAIDGTGAPIATFGGTFAPTNSTTLNEPAALVQISGTDLYTTGIFNTTTNFDPNGTFNLANITGGNNGFIHKMSACTASAQTPTIIGSASSLCAGDSRTISINNGANPKLLNSNNEWVWYSGTCGTGTIIGRGESITIAPTSTTSYYVRGEGGCVANGTCSNVYTVLVFPYPNANVTLSGNTLTSSQTSGTYQWLDCNNGNSNIAGATSQSYTPTVSGSYAVRVTNAGCTVTSSCTPVTLCNVASTPTISGNSTSCAGENVTLTVSAGSLNSNTQWTWYSGSCGGTLVGTGTSITVAPTATTSYFVRGEGGCSSNGPCSSAKTITVNALPNNAVTFSNTFTLLATQGFATYQWIDCNNNNAPIPGATSQSYTNEAGGNYAVIITRNGCTVTSACTTIAPCNATTPTVTGVTAICTGGSTTLSIASGNLNSQTQWTWYRGACGGTSEGTGTSITVSPTSTTNYYVRGEGTCSTLSNCSLVTTVTVNPLPSNSVTLSGSTLTATQAGATYQWLDCNNGNSNIAGATSQSYTPTVSGSYAVRITSTSGCVATSACTTVTVCAVASTPTVSGPNAVCSGQSITLSIATGNLNGNTSWKWYSGSCGGTLVGTGTSISVNPTTTTDYYVRGEGGCTANGNCSTVKTVTVNAIPNNAVTLSGSTLTATQAGATYQWLDCNNGNSNIAGATSQSYTPTVTGNYGVRITSSAGCVATSACTTVTVCSVASTPTVSGSNAVCSGQSITLSIATGNLNGNTSWKWYSSSCGGTLVGTGTSINVSPTTTTDYYVRGEGGCTANGNCSTVKTVTVNAIPNNAVTVSGSTLTATQAGATYQWLDCNNGNSNIAGATSQSYTPIVSGNYAVRITSTSGCVATSTCSNVLNTVSFEQLGIKLYPNPIKNRFTIDSEWIINQVTIYNLLGQKIREFIQNTNTYNVEELVNGTYLLEVTTDRGKAKTKIIKD